MTRSSGMAVVLAFKATTGSPFAPVTTANAFKGQGIGSNMLVAEAPQAMGRSLTLAYSGEDVRHTPIVFGGFSTQSRIGAPCAQPGGRLPIRPRGMRIASSTSRSRRSWRP